MTVNKNNYTAAGKIAVDPQQLSNRLLQRKELEAIAAAHGSWTRSLTKWRKSEPSFVKTVVTHISENRSEYLPSTDDGSPVSVLEENAKRLAYYIPEIGKKLVGRDPDPAVYGEDNVYVAPTKITTTSEVTRNLNLLATHLFLIEEVDAMKYERSGLGMMRGLRKRWRGEKDFIPSIRDWFEKNIPEMLPPLHEKGSIPQEYIKEYNYILFVNSFKRISFKDRKRTITTHKTVPTTSAERMYGQYFQIHEKTVSTDHIVWRKNGNYQLSK